MKHITLPPAVPAKAKSTRTSMRGNKSALTKPELSLSEKLEEAGIKGVDANYLGLPGTPDLVFLNKKLAIFVNGCFWHRCPYCNPHFPETNQEYWSAKFRRNKARDKRVKASLQAIGWRVMIIWECQLKKNPSRVLRRIEIAIGEHN